MTAPSELILQVYDAALDPTKWPEVLDRVSAFLGARGALIFRLGENGTAAKLEAPIFSASYDAARVAEYLREHEHQELVDQEKFALHSKQSDAIELVPDTILFDSEEEFLSRANVASMLKVGIRYRSGALLNKDNIYRDRFSMQFSRRHGPLSAVDIEKSGMILPHIAKALNVNRPVEQLFEKFRCVIGCLDLLKVGVCLLDKNGFIILKNSEFQRQLEKYDAYHIGATGKLALNDEKANQSVRQLLCGLERHGQFGARPRKEAVITVLDGEDYRLCIEVLPLHKLAELGSTPVSGYVLYSLDTSVPLDFNTCMMSNLFDLTTAETEVLGLIAQGLSNREIADRRSKSVETINSQAKSLFSKTYTANRTQLVRLATNLSANFLSESIT
jgi:DNA-binding CsgD family transcriptional regulator